MASEVANTVIGEATKPIIDYVKDQIDYAWNCNDYIGNLIDEVENLKDAKSKVEHLMDEAERGGQTIESPVHRWLGKAEKFIGEADEFLKRKNKAKEKCFVGLCRPWKTRYQMGRKAKEMLPDADKLKEKKKDILGDGVSYHERPKGIEPVKDFKIFDSRKSIFKNIMLALEDSDVAKIGVYGLDGVGKTTMVKAIATHAKEKNLFQDVVMATIFEEQNLKEMQGEEVVKLEPDLQRIQGEIKDGLGYQFRSESVKGRADELRELLKNEKRKKLVVLDDIWAGLKLDNVGIPSDHQGCKILMTSTNENVLKDMGSKKKFPPRCFATS